MRILNETNAKAHPLAFNNIIFSSSFISSRPVAFSGFKLVLDLKSAKASLIFTLFHHY